MKIKIGRCAFEVTPLFAGFLGLLFLFDRTGYMSLSLAAVVIHELGHVAVMKLCGQRVVRVVLAPGTVEIRRDACWTGPGREAAVTAGGIAANALAAALFLALWRIRGRDGALVFAVMNLALAGFNALPVRGLDGGDLLYLLLFKIAGHDIAARAVLWVSAIFSAGLAGCGVWLLFRGEGNVSLLICALYLGFLTLLSAKNQN